MIDIRRGRYVNLIADEWLGMVMKFFNDPCRPYIQLSPNKRLYFASYAHKLRYECLCQISVYAKNRKHRKACVRKLYYWWQHLNDIILISPASMDSQIEKWETKKIGDIILLRALSNILVRYYETLSNKYGHDLVNKLNIKTCPYCNRQFIYTFKGRAAERPELDHFYSKTVYPLFCLSFYNLIPACHSCNHVKSEEKIGLNPYSRAFGRKFVITDKRGGQLTKSQIYKLTEKEIKLDFSGNDIAEEINEKVLGLKDVYNKHTDYVKELIDKSMAYDAYARKALVESFQGAGYHPRQVYDFIWGRHLMDAEYEDRPLSKLTKDILDLLDIKRK